MSAESVPSDGVRTDLLIDDDRSLEDIAEDPTLEERVRYPLYWVGDDGEDPSEILDKAIHNIIKNFGEYEPEDLVVVIGDYGDSDGRGATAALKAKFDTVCPNRPFVYVPAGHRGGSPDTLTAIKRVTRVLTGADVYFVDIAPNDEQEDEYKDRLVSLAEENSLYVRDHHPWPDSVLEALDGVAEDIIVDDNQDDPVCTTEIVVREDFIDAPDYLEDLAEIVGIRDLWKDHLFDDYPESELISDFAFWADYGEFVDVIAEHGIDFADNVEGEDVVELFKENREEKHNRIEYAADKADWHTIAGVEVAIAYGNVHNSVLGQELQERGADLVGIITPTGKFSFRSDDAYPVCNTIAEQLNGGGHPCAAGANLERVVSTYNYEDMDDDEQELHVPYRKHWNEWGETMRRTMKRELEDKLPDAIEGLEESDSDSDSDSE